MLIGKSTIEYFDECLKTGFCDEHKRELEGIDLENHEAQRKAILFLRLQVFRPILFHKPFTFEKMKVLFQDHSFYGKSQNPESDPEFLENIIYLDAIVVYTICHFSKICCPGILFKQNKTDHPVECKDKHLLDILQKKDIDASEIGYLVPLFKKNFEGKKENLYKLGYVATMLLVRNISSRIELKSAIDKLDKELNNIPSECKKWLDMGRGEQSQQQYEGAIVAYTNGLKYSSYAAHLLHDRSYMYLTIEKFKEAALDSYRVLMIRPRCMQMEALCIFVRALFGLSLFDECLRTIEYAQSICDNDFHLNVLENVKRVAGGIRMVKMANRDAREKAIKNENVSNEPKETEKINSNGCKAPEEKKDIPELIEASDSESDDKDVPDLMEASNSDSSSDSEINVVDYTDDESTHAVDVLKSSEESDPKINVPNTDNLVDIEANIKKVKTLLNEASQNLLNGSPSALRQYREALDEIKGFPEVHEYSESEIVCIKYAFGTSYYKSGGYDDLQKAISTFKGIAEDHCSVTFPAAYYGIALANRKLNRFKEALHYLQIVDDILQGGPVKDYTWPESSTTIEETKTENLKALITSLLSECENPPSPEATCRSRDCSRQPAIYYSDPDFKGFFAIQCSSHCTLHFHPFCWKLLKTEKHLSDKEFLDQNCLTPDCEGFIIKIQNIDKAGDVKRVFESAEPKKSIKKKTRLEKKLEVKEEKRRKRKDSSGKNEATTESANEPNEQLETTKDNAPALETHCNKGDGKTEIKEPNEGPSTSKETPIYPETFTIIKKEKIVDENTNRVSAKVKEHKKTRNTISIDEFLDSSDTYGSTNEYQQRISALQQNKQNAEKEQKSTNILKPTAPAFEPLRAMSFAPNQTSYGLDDFPKMKVPVALPPTVYNTSPSTSDECTSPTFNPSMLLPPEFSIECAKKNIYSYLKNILYKHGPLKEGDPILVQELQGFPGEANAMIADCGGLGRFLQQSVDFAFVGEEYVCTADQITKAYDKKNNADIPLIPTEFSSLDGYCSYSNVEEDKVYSDSYLNPDAQEYSPPTNSKTGRNSPQLMSAISKLRQPLTVDEESSKTVNSYDLNSPGDGSKVADSVNYPSSSKGETSKCPTKLQLAHKCADAVRGYFSADASDYRSFIRQFIQPYAIVEVKKKSNVLVQTDNNEIENLLKDARKTDEELQRLKELVNCLTDENVKLKEQNDLLGEQCTLALDNVTKCQKKSSVELLTLRKELEDANLALEEQAKVSKGKESKLEKEIKHLSETLKKNKDEESGQKSEINNLQVANKNLKLSLTQAEERINLLLNEKHIIKTTLDLQIDKLKENVRSLETDKIKSLKRAEDAELKLLHFQKEEYLRRIDGKAADAVNRMKELQEGMAVANLNPGYAKNFFVLLTQIQGYISQLGATRIAFETNINEHINSVKNGTPLEALKPLEMKELPKIPSLSYNQGMQNGTVPSAQASFLNLNPMLMNRPVLNQIPGNSYFSPPINTPPPMPIGIPARQPAHPYANNISNQGAIPKIPPNPTVSAGQNQKKLPPGLSDPQPNFVAVPTETAKAPELIRLIPKKQQPVVAPPVASVSRTKAKEEAAAKPKASSSGTKSLGGSTLSLASEASKSSLDIKKSCDSLELDYTVKKSPAKTAKVPEPAASTSSKSGSNKKSYEKLMQRLRVVYPEATQAQITAMVKDFRSQKSSLSGLTIDMIINEIVAMVEAKKKEESRKALELAQKMRKIPSKPLANKKLSSCEEAAKELEMNAKRCAWGSSADASRQWHGKDVDEPCTICFEEMTPKTAYKVDCGHTFHRTCIQEWINKKSDCPICRVHLLLPEDYPAL